MTCRPWLLPSTVPIPSAGFSLAKQTNYPPWPLYRREEEGSRAESNDPECPGKISSINHTIDQVSCRMQRSILLSFIGGKFWKLICFLPLYKSYDLTVRVQSLLFWRLLLVFFSPISEEFIDICLLQIKKKQALRLPPSTAHSGEEILKSNLPVNFKPYSLLHQLLFSFCLQQISSHFLEAAIMHSSNFFRDQGERAFYLPPRLTFQICHPTRFPVDQSKKQCQVEAIKPKHCFLRFRFHKTVVRICYFDFSPNKTTLQVQKIHFVKTKLFFRCINMHFFFSNLMPCNRF